MLLKCQQILQSAILPSAAAWPKFSYRDACQRLNRNGVNIA